MYVCIYVYIFDFARFEFVGFDLAGVSPACCVKFRNVMHTYIYAVPTCMHTYMYICTHTYTYTYMYTHAPDCGACRPRDRDGRCVAERLCVHHHLNSTLRTENKRLAYE